MDRNILKEIIQEEKILYLGSNSSVMKRKHHKRYEIWSYIYYFRMSQYYSEVRKIKTAGFKKKIAKLMHKYYERRKNIASYKSGIEIGANSIVGRGLNIWHSGVVINGIIGDYCVFHGNNIIGNKGIGRENEVPRIGNSVDIGAGAVIIGDVNIANGCIIAANATVVKSIFEENSIIVGCNR